VLQAAELKLTWWFLLLGGFSKNTPVAASDPKKHLKFLKLTKTCRSTNYNTFLAPFIVPL
jgi:hypothetical protein